MNVFKIGFRKYIIGVNFSSKEQLEGLRDNLKSQFPKIKFVLISE